jgi:hypothetical protein
VDEYTGLVNHGEVKRSPIHVKRVVDKGIIEREEIEWTFLWRHGRGGENTPDIRGPYRNVAVCISTVDDV